MRYGLASPRQAVVLAALRALWAERGYETGPSLAEIGERAGGMSPGRVHAHLVALERLGIVRRLRPGQRAWAPAGDPPEEPAREARRGGQRGGGR